LLKLPKNLQKGLFTTQEALKNGLNKKDLIRRNTRSKNYLAFISILVLVTSCR